VLGSVTRILNLLEPKRGLLLYSSQASRFDGIARCWLLKRSLSGAPSREEGFLDYLEHLNAEARPKDQGGGKRALALS